MSKETTITEEAKGEYTSQAKCTCGWCGEVRKLGIKFVDSSVADALYHLVRMAPDITSNSLDIFTTYINRDKEILFRSKRRKQHKISIVEGHPVPPTFGEVEFTDAN